MGSVLAIVSKKVFERDFHAAPGEVVATAAYASAHKTLDNLASGGDLFLVTVAAGEQLWLVGVLRGPQFAKGAWTAKPNVVPITDVSPLIAKLAFDTGKGITARARALAMSLQTPRGLTEADVALLDGAKPVSTKPASKAKPKPASKPPATSVAKTAAAKPAKAAPAPFKLTASRAADDEDAPAAKASGADPDLAKAQSHLSSGAVVLALDDLLRAWARCRSREVGALIDQLGASIARSLPAITGNKKTIDAAWRDVGDQLRPADVPRLAVALDLGSAPQAEGWLDILLRFPIDPRLCAPAIDLSLKYVSSTAGPTRTRAFKLAETIADGRCLPQIEAILGKRRDAWNWTELKDRVRKMRERFAEPPALPAFDAATVKAIAKEVARIAKQPPLAEAALFAKAAAAEDDGARLLQGVLDDPHDDAARLVYADYLQQHDDPRGELIALQMMRTGGTLTRAQEDRERALVRDKHNVQRWLGPLVAVVRDPVFDRGFLQRCRVELKTAKQRADLIGHPLWATVESIHCTELALVEHPVMRSLKEVSGLDTALVLELAGRPRPVAFESLTHVRFEADEDDNDLPSWAQILESKALANLKHLGPFVGGWRTVEALGNEVEPWRWLVDSKLAKRLASLTLHVGRGAFPVAQWLDLFDERKHLERLELQAGQYDGDFRPAEVCCIATRGKGSTKLTLALDGPEEIPPRLFAGFPRRSVPELVVVMPESTKAQLERLRDYANEKCGQLFERVTVPGVV